MTNVKNTMNTIIGFIVAVVMYAAYTFIALYHTYAPNLKEPIVNTCKLYCTLFINLMKMLSFIVAIIWIFVSCAFKFVFQYNLFLIYYLNNFLKKINKNLKIYLNNLKNNFEKSLEFRKEVLEEMRGTDPDDLISTISSHDFIFVRKEVA